MVRGGERCQGHQLLMGLFAQPVDAPAISLVSGNSTSFELSRTLRLQFSDEDSLGRNDTFFRFSDCWQLGLYVSTSAQFVPTFAPTIKASIAWRIAASPSPSPPLSPLSPLHYFTPAKSPARFPSILHQHYLPIPIELLPPHKRFGTIKRIETAKERGESSLRAKTSRVAEFSILCHQRRILAETS
ncbi:hypothetical protein Tco_1404920 [Tanacetum coccineum]